MPQAKPATGRKAEDLPTGTPRADVILRCPQAGCGLAGADIGNCGNAGSVMPCPAPVPVKPATDVVISCQPCGKTWAVSVPDTLMKRGQSLPRCCGSTDRCRAVVVKPA